MVLNSKVRSVEPMGCTVGTSANFPQESSEIFSILRRISEKSRKRSNDIQTVLENHSTENGLKISRKLSEAKSLANFQSGA